MLKRVACALMVSGSVVLTQAAAQAPSQSPSQKTVSAGSQNERICEDITLTGSRIATKRFCGTRAQWADKKLQDKQEVERIQRSPCVLTHNSPSGKPAC